MGGFRYECFSPAKERPGSVQCRRRSRAGSHTIPSVSSPLVLLASSAPSGDEKSNRGGTALPIVQVAKRAERFSGFGVSHREQKDEAIFFWIGPSYAGELAGDVAVFQTPDQDAMAAGGVILEASDPARDWRCVACCRSGALGW